MNLSTKTRIALWNAVTIAEAINGNLTFTARDAALLVAAMGEEAGRFTWKEDDKGNIAFMRKDEP